MTLIAFYIHVLFSIFLIETDIVAADELSSLLSRLYNSALKSNKPLVLVFDKNNIREELNNPDSEEEYSPPMYLIQSRASPSPPSLKRVPSVNGLGGLGNLGHFGNFGSLGNLDSLGKLGSLDGLLEVPVNQPKSSHQHKVNRGQLTGVRSTTPSSIHSLLRQSECDANDACVQKCKNRFEGRKEKKCKTKCKITFECPPESDHNEDYDDPCEDEDKGC